jgi:hypothetical protein
MRLDSGARSPYSLHAGIAIERQLTGKTSVAIGYTRSRGVRLFRMLDINAPVAQVRPDPAFGPVRQITASGASVSNSLNVNFTGSLGRVFRGTIVYTLAGISDNLYNGLPPNSYDLSREWARAGSDRRHRLRILGSFRLWRQIELGAIFSAETGSPYEWALGEDINGDGEAAERPDGVRRNALRGPGAARLDLRLARRFALRDDGPELTLRLDAFNALNMVNYTRVVGNQSSPFFGQRVAAEEARRLQAGVELEF